MSASFSDNTQPRELSTGQLNAVDVLVVGGTDADAAQAAGVSRPTVWTWRNRNPHFRAELNRRRQEVWGASVERVRALIPTALDAIERELMGGSDAYKAALKLLDLAGMGAADYRPHGPTDAARIAEDEARSRRADEYYSQGLDEYGAGPITEEEIRRTMADLSGDPDGRLPEDPPE